MSGHGPLHDARVNTSTDDKMTLEASNNSGVVYSPQKSTSPERSCPLCTRAHRTKQDVVIEADISHVIPPVVHRLLCPHTNSTQELERGTLRTTCREVYERIPRFAKRVLLPYGPLPADVLSER